MAQRTVNGWVKWVLASLAVLSLMLGTERYISTTFTTKERHKSDIQDVKDLLKEVRDDVKELLRRNGG